MDNHFLRVQEAYETLCNVELRRQYDAKLQQDELTGKRKVEAVVVSDEVFLANMRKETLEVAGGGVEEVIYTHHCRCGDLYEITENEFQDGVNVVPCTGCSLYIRVLS
ncbi:hypothetical protein PsorP6_016109 [Peronosclerospora sorghi]|uniref:Uncharacterized protein n=1 Tax=Peronosclerospora sorghi TaxID=230839 RepID=A0ACC0VN94_9STRA|nr:hypothetical protein PsorP6_016109 [Peronosclerospora sorghi]